MLEKLGGQDTLRKAVDIFYEKQLSDPALKAFFEGANIQILKWHQFNLMSIAFTAVPEQLDVAALIMAKHQRLFDEGLSEEHFDIVIKHFRDTLRELDVDDSLTEEAVAVVMPLRQFFAQGAADAKIRQQDIRWRQHAAKVAAIAVIGFVAAGVWRRHHKTN